MSDDAVYMATNISRDDDGAAFEKRGGYPSPKPGELKLPQVPSGPAPGAPSGGSQESDSD